MFKVQITKNNIVTNIAQFATELEAQAWLDAESANGSFGKIQREVREIKIVDADGVETIFLDNNEDISLSMSIRDQYDLEGNIIRYHTLPAEFTSAITDITAQALAEKESADALKYLNDTDWMLLRELDGGTAMTLEVKALRAAARLKVI